MTYVLIELALPNLAQSVQGIHTISERKKECLGRRLWNRFLHSANSISLTPQECGDYPMSSSPNLCSAAAAAVK